MEFFTQIFEALGLGGGEAGAIGLIILVSRAIAKLIPDSASGVVGVIRQVLKVLGAYTENRKT